MANVRPPFHELVVVALIVDRPAVVVQLTVQLSLLTLCNVAAVLCLVPLQLPLDASVAGLVAGGLFAADLPLANALINPVFLIVDAALNFVHARMSRVHRLGECRP